MGKEIVVSTAAGMLALSVATPWVSPRVFEAWFSFPNIIGLAPIPIVSVALVIGLHFNLKSLPSVGDKFRWAPFSMTVALFVLAFSGWHTASSLMLCQSNIRFGMLLPRENLLPLSWSAHS